MYDHTRSLLVAMLMYVMIVFGSLVLIPTTPSEIPVTFDLVFAAELWLLVAAVAIKRSPGIRYEQLRRNWRGEALG